jgi:hypothetical protein
VGIAIEGLFCILMAAPIAIPLALLGALLAYKIQEPRYLQPQPHAMLGLFLVIPLLAGVSAREKAGGGRRKARREPLSAAGQELVRSSARTWG